MEGFLLLFIFVFLTVKTRDLFHLTTQLGNISMSCKEIYNFHTVFDSKDAPWSYYVLEEGWL